MPSKSTSRKGKEKTEESLRKARSRARNAEARLKAFKEGVQWANEQQRRSN